MVKTRNAALTASWGEMGGSCLTSGSTGFEWWAVKSISTGDVWLHFTWKVKGQHVHSITENKETWRRGSLQGLFVCFIGFQGSWMTNYTRYWSVEETGSSSVTSLPPWRVADTTKHEMYYWSERPFDTGRWPGGWRETTHEPLEWEEPRTLWQSITVWKKVGFSLHHLLWCAIRRMIYLVWSVRFDAARQEIKAWLNSAGREEMVY